MPIDNAKFGSDCPSIVVLLVEAVFGKGKNGVGLVTGTEECERGRMVVVTPELVLNPDCPVFALGCWGQGIEVMFDGHM